MTANPDERWSPAGPTETGRLIAALVTIVERALAAADWRRDAYTIPEAAARLGIGEISHVTPRGVRHQALGLTLLGLGLGAAW